MLLEAIDDATSNPSEVRTVIMDFEKAEENAFRECLLVSRCTDACFISHKASGAEFKSSACTRNLLPILITTLC